MTAAAAHAQAPSPRPAAEAAEPTDRPWAAGVSAADQARALALFGEGNALFAAADHTAALVKYRQAIAAWDHPAIRFNIAVALIRLDQPLAAYDNLEHALRYDAAPFEKETYEQALTYRKLLLGQLAELVVACDEPGAEVVLDGVRLFVAAGQVTHHLAPGPHQLVATKPGHQTASRPLILTAGQRTVENLALPIFRSTPPRMVRRWPAWKPWVVAAAGVAFAAVVGIPLELQARSDANGYDAAVQMQCPAGCKRSALPGPVRDLAGRVPVESGAAIGAFALGGAAAAAGVVWALVNRPRAVEAPRAIEAPAWSLVPLATPLGAGAALRVAF